MNPFTYHRATNPSDAIADHNRVNGAKFIGGGTNLIDLMKENVEHPSRLVDLNHVGLREVSDREGVLKIGALVTNNEAAYHPLIEKDFPLLSEAILAGASPQLRNMATCGGNLLQRTRCYYFYDTATACNKREPGSGCDALKGYNRIHAVLGASDKCIATHPSDMCVALAALDTTILAEGTKGVRKIAFADFHRLPGDTPEKDTNLAEDEMITGLELRARFSRQFKYLKVRDRSSYAFALVSAAVGLESENGVIKKAAVAMGGVAHKPWRDFEAEKTLHGEKPSEEVFKKFATSFFKGAAGYGHNDFKIELGQRTLVRALSEAAAKGVWL